MESILPELLSKILKELADHILAYLGIGAVAVAGATYVFKLRYKKSLVRSESNQDNEAPLTAADDIVNGNQTLITNYYVQKDTTEKLSVTDYKNTPVPHQILKEVEKLPPSAQTLAQENYVGQNFQWDVKFHKLKKKDDESDQFRVYFSDPEAFGKPMIYCDLSLKEHPNLKAMETGDILKVAGKLNCFAGREMKLDLEKIYLNPS